MKDTKNYEYGSAQGNKNRAKAKQVGFPMLNKEYERIELQNSSGMKVCFEFPKNAETSAGIAQEVRAILSDELRDSLRKNVG